MEKLILDSDVLINWLTLEEETTSGRKLWVAPAAILELGERKHATIFLSLLSFFEVRYVMRRKKSIDLREVENDLRLLGSIVSVQTPTAGDLLQANQLQSEHPLDPFDSVLLSQSISLKGIMITRDSKLLQIAGRFIPCFTPEQYIEDRMTS
jgi:PIN domain nuclease of toxin-antitoxin system